MKLKILDIKQFKKDIYKYYKKLFPVLERKSYRTIKRVHNNGIMKILGIFDESELVGFMIVNELEESKYIQLDYFAILAEYQSKGYGKRAIMELKNLYSECYGIIIEAEKLGLGKNDKENEIRKRRVKFYEQLGFVKLKHDLELYKVIYSLYVLTCNDIKEDNNRIIEELFKIYKKVFGEKRVNKNCKVLIDK